MPARPHSSPIRGAAIASWITRLVVVIILLMGAIPKFTGGAGSLAAKLPGGIGAVTAIGVAEFVSVVLILVPKTSLYGAALASAVMLGAVASHVVAPVGMKGEFQSMFFMALLALAAASGTVTLLLCVRRSAHARSGAESHGDLPSPHCTKA